MQIPIWRVLRNNSVGLIAHILFMAWVSGAFYATGEARLRAGHACCATGRPTLLHSAC